jgi:hypothetical protein
VSGPSVRYGDGRATRAPRGHAMCRRGCASVSAGVEVGERGKWSGGMDISNAQALALPGYRLCRPASARQMRGRRKINPGYEMEEENSVAHGRRIIDTDN